MGLDENFYSYLYFQALDDLIKNHDDPIKEHLLQFDAFTDIEFNPKSLIVAKHLHVHSLCFFKSTHEKSIPKTKKEFLNIFPSNFQNERKNIS